MNNDPYPGESLGHYVKRGLIDMAIIILIGSVVALIATGIHTSTAELDEPDCTACGCITKTESINIQAGAL
jgi:hypothetical protein